MKQEAPKLLLLLTIVIKIFFEFCVRALSVEGIQL
jgi:hypothetical protein